MWERESVNELVASLSSKTAVECSGLTRCYLIISTVKYRAELNL
jgi:hypothetical protein